MPRRRLSDDNAERAPVRSEPRGEARLITVLVTAELDRDLRTLCERLGIREERAIVAGIRALVLASTKNRGNR